MSTRTDLHQAIGRLQSTLAKAERRLHLGQPLRSTDLYAEAIEAITQLTADIQERVDQATRPPA